MSSPVRSGLGFGGQRGVARGARQPQGTHGASLWPAGTGDEPHAATASLISRPKDNRHGHSRVLLASRREGTRTSSPAAVTELQWCKGSVPRGVRRQHSAERAASAGWESTHPCPKPTLPACAYAAVAELGNFFSLQAFGTNTPLFHLPPPQQSSKTGHFKYLIKKKSSSDQQTYFFLKFQSKHSLTPWISMYFHPVGFYLLKYKWWECHVSLS